MAQSLPKPLLGSTLAERIQILRESNGLSQSRLAEEANMPLSQIEDIEGGLELFLSPATRQKLARVLKVKSSTIKAVEKEIDAIEPRLSEEARGHFIDEIVHFPNQQYFCPFCKSPLEARIFHRKDLEDNPLVEVKANCSKCLFKL
jgi:transcriptional regulator with XRE-family HTH domain